MSYSRSEPCSAGSRPILNRRVNIQELHVVDLKIEMMCGVPGEEKSTKKDNRAETGMIEMMDNCVVQVGRYSGKTFGEISRDLPDCCGGIMKSQGETDRSG